MRTFVAVSHTIPLDSEFSLDDLAGGAGRVDVICRYITAAFLLSHGIREAVRVWVVVQDTMTLEFRGDELKHLNPDERSTAALVRSALEVGDDRAVSTHPVTASPGIYVRRQGLETTLEEVTGPVLQLHVDGEPFGPDTVPSDPTFVLSDHRDLTEDEQATVDVVADRRVSVGPRALHGNHAIAVAHNHCDLATEGNESID